MTEGQFAEYSWENIVDLIYNDLGIDVPSKTKDSPSTNIRFYYLNDFNPPVDTKSRCIRVLKYTIKPCIAD